MGESAEKDAELKKLKTIVEQEKSHAQWAKQAMNFTLLIALIIMNLLIGSKSAPSIIGLAKCSPWYWIIQVVFILLCIYFTWLAVGMNKEVQRIKTKYGNINLVDSDIRFEGKSLTAVLCLGFAGGWVAGALGLGGGAIFNPALLALGVPPKVSSATGLYLVCFSKIASCFIYYLAGELNIPYSLWIGLWSTVGSLLGIWAT